MSLGRDDTRSVLINGGDGENSSRNSPEKHLSPDECDMCNAIFSQPLHGRIFDAQPKATSAKPSKVVWFWNSKYDDDLGTCHPDLNDFCQ